jgi:hypothetical protein
MRAIKNIFLRAKHWQIFCLLVVLPFVIEIAVKINFGAGVDLATREDPFEGREMAILLSLATFLSFSCTLVWFCSTGSFLSSTVPPRIRMNARTFHFALIFLPMYFAVILLLAAFNRGHSVLAGVLIVPLNLLTMYCLLYLLYFVSKNLAMAELGSRVSFSDYSTSFFFLVFFPIGIWFIQPRINRVYAVSLNTEKPAQADTIQ